MSGVSGTVNHRVGIVLFEILDERSVWSCCVDYVDCIETWHKKEFEDCTSILIECIPF